MSTSLKSIFNICLKVMGVYYALSALNTLPSSISQMVLFWPAWKYTADKDPLSMMNNYKIASLVGLFIPILLFFFSVLIIFRSEQIATFLLRKEEVLDNVLPDGLASNALNLSIKIFGFFSVLSSIPYVSDLLSSYWEMSGNLKFYDKPAKIKLASFGISAILYIGVGLILMFYSNVIADSLLKADSKEAKEANTTET
jgi:hypothetical protein